MRTVFCGLTTIDLIQQVEHFPAADQKVTSQAALLDVGGPAANAARTAGALGAQPTLASPIGLGVFGKLAAKWLTNAGVAVVDLASEGDPAISSVTIDSHGHRSVVSTNNTGRAHGFPGPSILDGATALLVDGHLLDVQIALARTAESSQIPVVLDGGSYKPGIESLLPHVTHAVLSADFHFPENTHAPADDATELAIVAGFGIPFVARTHGGGALEALVNQKYYRLPITPVAPAEIADTLGAGDVLHGAFTAALGAGHDAMASLASAAQLATMSVRHAGAMGWVKELADVYDAASSEEAAEQ